MARARTAKHPALEELPPSPPQETISATKSSAGDSAPSKAEAVRIAMSEGIESPDDGVAFIKQRFGIDMPKPMWSSYKAQQKARESKATGQPRARQTQPTAIPAGFSSDVKELRKLIEQAGGIDQFREQVAGLGSLLSKYGPDPLIELAEVIS